MTLNSGTSNPPYSNQVLGSRARQLLSYFKTNWNRFQECGIQQLIRLKAKSKDICHLSHLLLWEKYRVHWCVLQCYLALNRSPKLILTARDGSFPESHLLSNCLLYYYDICFFKSCCQAWDPDMGVRFYETVSQYLSMLWFRRREKCTQPWNYTFK